MTNCHVIINYQINVKYRGILTDGKTKKVESKYVIIPHRVVQLTTICFKCSFLTPCVREYFSFLFCVY